MNDPRYILPKIDLGACLPGLADMNWHLMREAVAFCVGVGAVNRPLAEFLAYLGVRRFCLVDPKSYKAQSVVSQCEPHEVGCAKAGVVAERLNRLGAEAIPLVADVLEIEPGHVTPDSVVIVSADNRRAEIGAARLAASMRVPFMKVNVEPLFLMASIRCYDLRATDYDVCPECQMSDEQYLHQRHPRSCDGTAERATGSPRALCSFAAAAGALSFAQIVGSPGHWAHEWCGRQWQATLLGGQASWSRLSPKPNCRWEHGRHWDGLERIVEGPTHTTLASLFDRTGWQKHSGLQIRVSGSLATRGMCDRCGAAHEILHWVRTPSDSVGRCGCSGTLTTPPFWTYQQIAAEQLSGWWARPLAAWAVPPYSIVAFENEQGQHKSFVIGNDRAGPLHRIGA
jgi:hypothetical protein